MGKLINISFLKNTKQYIDIDTIMTVRPDFSSYYDNDGTKHNNILYYIKLINNDEYILPTYLGEQIIKEKGLIEYE